MTQQISNLEQFTQQVRRDILRMVHAVNSGHPGGSLGCAEFIVALYQDILNHGWVQDGDRIDPMHSGGIFNHEGHEVTRRIRA